MTPRIRAATPLLAALAIGAPALANGSKGYLYGIDVPGNLFRIDLATGEGTSVGTIPFIAPEDPFRGEEPELDGFNEIEFDNLTQRAWAQQRNGNFQAQEFQISNGIGIGDPVFNGASWHGLEFIDGTLYGAGFAFGLDPIPDATAEQSDAALGTLDPETGEYEIIGQFGITNQITGLAWDGQTLYGISNRPSDPDYPDIPAGIEPEESSALYEINMDTGAASLIGYTGIVAGSLEFGPDGNLYAGGVASWAGDLYRIDPDTGESTFIGATGFGTFDPRGNGGQGRGNGISGLAYVIPTPSAAAILSFGALAGLRRRR